MELFIKKYSKNSLVISILLLILSLFLIFKPAESLNFMVIFLGSIIILDGIIHMVSYFFSTPQEFRTFSFELLQGVIAIILGLVFVVNPTLITGILPFIIGAWIIVESLIRFQFALNIRKIENSNWFVLTLVAVLTGVIGLVVILNPFGTAVAITALAGILLLSSEIINIIEAIYIMRKF